MPWTTVRPARGKYFIRGNTAASPSGPTPQGAQLDVVVMVTVSEKQIHVEGVQVSVQFGVQSSFAASGPQDAEIPDMEDRLCAGGVGCADNLASPLQVTVPIPGNDDRPGTARYMVHATGLSFDPGPLSTNRRGPDGYFLTSGPRPGPIQEVGMNI
jgi:hypothetical protein